METVCWICLTLLSCVAFLVRVPHKCPDYSSNEENIALCHPYFSLTSSNAAELQLVFYWTLQLFLVISSFLQTSEPEQQ